MNKAICYFTLLLWGLLLTHQTARADGVVHLALDETFDVNTGTGGRDNQYSGSVASNNIRYDIDGWSGTTIYGGKACMRFGNSNSDGTCTTPEIILVGTARTATLTFSAAGWGSGTNKLTVSANEGVALTGDVQTTLTNGKWNTYTVNITLTTAESLQLTFSGKRGFLDDVKVTETVTAIADPQLADEHLFWPNTTETATKSVTLIPADSTTVYYTTDGTEPSTTNGKVAKLTSMVGITGTTTVKAKAYYETVASNVVSRTYTVGQTVNGIAQFKALADGTEARLYMGATDNVRVLHGHDGKQMYLRADDGTLCLDFGTTAVFNPAPQHNQHVAGWVVGRKETIDGLTTLVATANTSTDFLALAAPVTEAPTQPVTVSDPMLADNYVGDWVTVSAARVGYDVSVDNRFNADGYTEAYYGALTDLSAIVTATGATLSPVSYDGIKPVVYVIDENQDFVSPASNIANATVRLVRTMSKDYWNTFTVPIDMPISGTMDGEYRQYDSQDAQTMHFVSASSIEAGMPYLVKPYVDIVNPVFTNVTLSATAAKRIEQAGGNYDFVATYSPRDLEVDQTELFLKPDGHLYYPQDAGSARMKGLRAWFYAADGSSVRLYVEGDEVMGISSLNNSARGDEGTIYSVSGVRVSRPQKGVYIMNGKKIIIH